MQKKAREVVGTQRGTKSGGVTPSVGARIPSQAFRPRRQTRPARIGLTCPDRFP
jgi:hypothetical protein